MLTIALNGRSHPMSILEPGPARRRHAGTQISSRRKIAAETPTIISSSGPCRIYCDPEQWRARAKAALDLAEQMIDQCSSLAA